MGPVGENAKALASCYRRALDVLVENQLRTICFCCISTGVYGYPIAAATHVALATTRAWLEHEDNADKVDKIVFCVFLDRDRAIYEQTLPHYFPVDTPPPSSDGEAKEDANRQPVTSPIADMVAGASRLAKAISDKLQLERHSSGLSQEGDSSEVVPNEKSRDAMEVGESEREATSQPASAAKE